MVKVLLEESYWVISNEDSKKFLEDDSAGVSEDKYMFFYVTTNPRMATQFPSRDLAVKFLQTWPKKMAELELDCVEKHTENIVAED